jgi:3-hydroxyisobutyrate dehydrogenase
MRAAFLGLGAIGRPMAARLARVAELVVWNRTGRTAGDLAALCGCRAAATPGEAARGAEIVVTCLPTSAEVESLLDGPSGLLAGMASGSLLVDCTSGDPVTSQRIATRLAAQQVEFVDAPVSGGTNGAEAGTLTIMVGGSATAVARARPVLAAMGSRIEHMGPVGSGDAMKAVNNALLAVNIVALGEGLTGLAKSGVPGGLSVEVLNASSGRSFVSQTLVPERVLTGTFPGTFRLALLDKDVGIAVDFLAAMGVDAPLLRLTRDLLHRARAALGEQSDYLDLVRLKERETGTEIRGR